MVDKDYSDNALAGVVVAYLLIINSVENIIKSKILSSAVIVDCMIQLALNFGRSCPLQSDTLVGLRPKIESKPEQSDTL